MIPHTAKIAVEVVAGVLAVFVLLVGIALWRVWTGPVELDFLTPRIEAALADPESGLSVQIGATELTWGGWARTIDLHVRDVRISDRDGASLAVLPDAIIRLSLRALVQGTVAPTVVELIGSRVRVVREPDGRFSFGQWDDQALEEADFTGVLPSIVARLLAHPAAHRPLAFLTAVRIVDGRVSVDDRRLGLSWDAPDADIELRRSAAGLAGDATLAIDLGGTRARLAAGFLYDRTTNRIDLTADFAELHPEALASLAPVFEKIGALTAPLDGTVSASVGLDGAVDSLRVELSSGPGMLRLVDLFPDGLPIRRLKLLGRVSGPERRLEVEQASLSLGTAEAPGPELSGAGTIVSSRDGFAGDLDIEARVRAAGVPLAAFDRYWPQSVARNARAWVTRNITAGTVEDVDVETSLHVPAGAFADTEIARLAGKVRYRDLEVHYFRPMPPVVAVFGTGTFDQHHIVFNPEHGTRGALQVKPSTVEISGLGDPIPQMDLNLAIVGPLPDTLALLDHERLGLVTRLGIDPAATAGQMAARVLFRFPLLHMLTVDQVEVSATANLEQVAVRDFLLGQDAANGSLALDVDRTGMRIEGPVELGGVPVGLVWTEAFGAQAKRRRTLEVEVSRLDEAGRKNFGLDLAPYLSGPVSASIVATSDRTGNGTIKAALNLREAALAIEDLSWAKPAGTAGKAFLTLALQNNRLAGIDRIDIDAGTLHARGAGRFDGQGGLAALDLESLAFDDTRLDQVRLELRGDGLAVAIGGGTINAAPFLESGPVRGQRKSFRPLSLAASKLETVRFAPDRYMENVHLSLERTRLGWQRIVLAGDLPRALWSPPRKPASVGRAQRERMLVRGDEARATFDEGAQGAAQQAAKGPPEPVGPKTLRIQLVPADGGGLRLDVFAEDMGAALRALNVLDTVHGGHMTIVGHSDGPLPGRPLEGHIEAENYIVVDAPALARLLTVASLTGISDLLSGEGIRFQRLTGDFKLEEGKIETDLMRAYGSALGLTAKGSVDIDHSEFDLRGTVVPAYTVNRILGQIPLLGPILTGGEGEGFLAVTYSMTGALDDPKVSVNPLSALTPGFLRNLFSAGGGEDGERPSALPERVEP